MKRNVEKVPAWGFELLNDGSLCYWAEPDRSSLNLSGEYPPDCYKPVAVYIVRRKDLKPKRRKKK